MQDSKKISRNYAEGETFSDHHLIIVDGQLRVSNIELKRFNKSRISFGTQEDSDIRLKSPIVSRKHGLIEIIGDSCYLYDTNSLNGIFLNGKKMRSGMENDVSSAMLQDGMSIRIDSDDFTHPHRGGVVMIYSMHPADGEWDKISLNKKITIGRDSACDLRIPHQIVSRVHAEIYNEGQNWYIRDNNSTNGTIINGSISSGAHKLMEKDVICIAGAKFIYSSGMIIYNVNASKATLKITGLGRTVTDKQKPKVILSDVSIDIKPREFVAIIGGSGAGKTTLLNAICGFERADAGTVLFNGLDLYVNFDSLKSMIGYVPQQDIVHDSLSVRRMLMYTARIRMTGDLMDEEVDRIIDEVLDIVDLRHDQHTLIRKLSGGQRKRASIAVELLANPSLFLLDEPTSGLDPDIEENLMRTLRFLSHEQGKTIVMVTHVVQNIDLCDKVIVMGSGGCLCYYGSPRELMDFFDVDRITSVYNLVSKNPQEWRARFDALKTKKNIVLPSTTQSQKKASIPFWKQFTALCGRYFEIIRNDMRKISLLLAQPIIIALLIMLVPTENLFSLYEETKLVMFAMSCACLWVGLFNSIQEICKERNIVKREYLANLRLSAYITSKMTVQLLIACVQGILFTAVCAAAIGLPVAGFYVKNSFWEVGAIIILTIFVSSSMGFLISAVSKTNSQAMLVTPFVLMFQLLFSGVLFEMSGIKEKVSYLTISRWSTGLLGIISDLNGLPTRVQAALPGTPRWGQELIYERTTVNFFGSIGALLLFSFVCGVASVIVLRAVSRDTR